MRMIACLLALALAATAAQAGRNADGTMIVHTNDYFSYCNLAVCTAPEGDPGTCEGAGTLATRDAGQVVWLLAYWCPWANPGVTVIYFGIDYDDTNLDPGAAYKLCGPAGSLEVPDADWPYTGRGNSVAFGSPVVGDTLFPFYVFKIDGGTDGSYFGTSINPTGGYAAFVDDSNPPLMDYCYHFGAVRWNQNGANDCPGCGGLRGACCFPDGFCAILTIEDCMTAGGTYQGDGTLCDANPCPPPGACCFEDMSCWVLTEPECSDAGGMYQGDFVPCDPNPCDWPPIEGACCFPDGSCRYIRETDCLNEGGTYQADFVPCDPNPCSPVAAEPTTWGRIRADYR